MTAVLRVLVWERQQLCRSGLASIIGCAFEACDVATAGRPDEAISWLAATHTPSVMVLDGGIDLAPVSSDGIRGLRCSYPQLSVAIVDWRRDRELALKAIAEGAHGFILKDMEQDEMLQAFRQIVDGQVYVPPIVSDVKALATGPSGSHQASISSLTVRQRDVLTHMSMGKSNKEIARSLSISESTVKVHAAAAFRLLGVHNRVGAVAMLQSRGDGAALLRSQVAGRRRVRNGFRTPAYG